MNSIEVSVIIPVLNEERVIRSCLESLARQSLAAGRFEVIVVDNGCTDRTIDIALQYQPLLDVRILQRKGVGVSALRNAAAQIARGEFLAFLDADCIAPARWLERGIQLLRSGRYGVVGAHYTIPPLSSWVARAWYGDMVSRKQGPVAYVPAGDLLVGREVFLDLGGFDETIHTSEDCEFCQRVAARGMAVVGDPDLSVVHLGTPQTLNSFYRKQRWHGANVHKVFFRNIRQASGIKSTLFTFYMLAAMCATAIAIPAALLGSWLALAGPALLLVGPLLLGAGAALVRRQPALWPPLAALYFVYGLSRAMCVLVSRPVRPAPATPARVTQGVYTNGSTVESE